MQETHALPPSVDDESTDEFRTAIRQQAIGHISARPRGESRVVTIALALAVLLHLLAAWWLFRLMSARPSIDIDRIEVRLLDVVQEPPPPPQIPQRQPPPSVPPIAAPSRNPSPRTTTPEIAARIVTPEPAMPLQLLEKNGAIRLPAETSTKSFTAKHDADIARARELMRRGHNLLHCRRRDNPRATPEEVANAAGSDRETYLGMFHYPGSDAMLDRMAAPGDVAATREAAVDRETAARAVCDATDYLPVNANEPR
jgi:hypothetical protein